MPNIIFNNESIEISENLSLEDVLTQWNAVSKPFAVALNKTFIPSHQFSEIKLKEDDSIDIITPMQGG